MRQSTYFAVLATFLASKTVADSGFSPVRRGLMNFQVRQSDGCGIGEVACGNQCFELGAKCCPDDETACALGKTCQKGDDGRYGCCDLGEICTGSAPDETDAPPSPTRDSGGFSVPAYTTAQPTGSSGDSGDSDDTSGTGIGGIGGLPTSTGSSGGSGGSGASSEACQSDLASLNSSPMPTAPPDLMKAMSSNTDVCGFKPPGSLSSEWNSFTKAFKSWADDHKDLLQKIEKDCGSGQKVPDLSKCGGSSGSGGSSSGGDGNGNGVGQLATSATVSLVAFLTVSVLVAWGM